jgi:hypothetical protein
VPQQVKRRRDGSVYLLAIKGKGGKIRDVDAVPSYAEEVWALAQRGIREGWNFLVPYKPHSSAPIHQIRALYAWSIYTQYARPIHLVPRRELYHCRESMAGYVFDKKAMSIVSRNLGHNRLNVVINYFAVALAVKDAEVIKNL